MGKSAGKWIKTVLFGKKHPKSNLSKNAASDKKASMETAVENQATNSPLILDPCQLTERDSENFELKKGLSGPPCDTSDLSHTDQGADSHGNNTYLAVSNPEEMRRQDQAATKAQAVYRGYMARRAFRALKGIMRLQALVRGHLVRRQAVATLCCMQSIVKFQVLVRERKVQTTDAKTEPWKKLNVGELQVNSIANSFWGLEKLATNTFIRKLLVALPYAKPLSFQYDLTEPNSAWNWLERWSSLHFWDVPVQTKKSIKTKPHKKQNGAHVVEPEAGKSRRTVRKAASAITSEENGVAASSEIETPKRNQRKVTSSPADVGQEQPQNELERVKRNLRKISALAVSEHTETDNNEKPKPVESVEIAIKSEPSVVSKQETVISASNPVESDVAVDNLDFLETSPNATIDQPVYVTHENHPVIETHSLENGQKMEHSPSLDDKEELNGKENTKTHKRRSLPAKQQVHVENVPQNSRSVPSYMAATESAKAKLRAQESPKFGEDEEEYGITRRHSLPAPVNRKSSSFSPGMQKHAQSNGKGGSKTNRPLTSSRDEKVVQPGWRR